MSGSEQEEQTLPGPSELLSIKYKPLPRPCERRLCPSPDTFQMSVSRGEGRAAAPSVLLVGCPWLCSAGHTSQCSPACAEPSACKCSIGSRVNAGNSFGAGRSSCIFLVVLLMGRGTHTGLWLKVRCRKSSATGRVQVQMCSSKLSLDSNWS